MMKLNKRKFKCTYIKWNLMNNVFVLTEILHLGEKQKHLNKKDKGFLEKKAHCCHILRIFFGFAILNPKSLSVLKVIFTTKRVLSLVYHGSKRKLTINKLDLKNITWITSYNIFKSFSKHMNKIGHLECTNIKWGNSWSKWWQTCEGSKQN